VDFGVDLGRCNPSRWLDVARAADELGYESLWLPEHLIFPATIDGSPAPADAHVTVDPRTPLFDAFAMLAALGAVTERIRLGTNVFNIGLRHPFTTARGAATVDVISHGRMILGVGASWLAAEWDAVGLDFAGRGTRVDESIGICRRLWADDVVEHAGEHFRFGPVVFEPKPVQAHLPVHVGGDSLRALRRTAELGDGWIAMVQDPSTFATAVGRLRELCGRNARDLDTVDCTAMARRPDAAEREAWRVAGATRLIVAPWARTADALDGLAAFARANSLGYN
jgi:probable F420-dependent oxidoreductase